MNVIDCGQEYVNSLVSMYNSAPTLGGDASDTTISVSLTSLT